MRVFVIFLCTCCLYFFSQNVFHYSNSNISQPSPIMEQIPFEGCVLAAEVLCCSSFSSIIILLRMFYLQLEAFWQVSLGCEGNTKGFLVFMCKCLKNTIAMYKTTFCFTTLEFITLFVVMWCLKTSSYQLFQLYIGLMQDHSLVYDVFIVVYLCAFSTEIVTHIRLAIEASNQL